MSADVAQAKKGAGSSATSVTVTLDSATISGNTIVVFVTDPNNNLSISDNKGNTYTQVAAQAAGSTRAKAFVAENITGGSGHQVTASWSVNTADPVVSVIEVSGVVAAAYDSAVTATATDSSEPYTATSGTTSQAAELLLALCGPEGVVTSCAESSGFTVVTEEYNFNSFWTHSTWSRAVSSVGSYTPSFTITDNSGSEAAAVIVLGFKAAADAGGGGNPSTVERAGALRMGPP